MKTFLLELTPVERPDVVLARQSFEAMNADLAERLVADKNEFLATHWSFDGEVSRMTTESGLRLTLSVLGGLQALYNYRLIRTIGQETNTLYSGVHLEDGEAMEAAVEALGLRKGQCQWLPDLETLTYVLEYDLALVNDGVLRAGEYRLCKTPIAQRSRPHRTTPSA